MSADEGFQVRFRRILGTYEWRELRVTATPEYLWLDVSDNHGSPNGDFPLYREGESPLCDRDDVVRLRDALTAWLDL